MLDVAFWVFLRLGLKHLPSEGSLLLEPLTPVFKDRRKVEMAAGRKPSAFLSDLRVAPG